jgi:RNA polymerase sigma-70 factor (ECF subfamily)
MTSSQEDAADVAQQAVLQAWGAWDGFDGKAAPATWIYRILLNCVQDWRRRRSAVPGSIPDEYALPDDSAPDAAAQAVRQEELQGLRQAIRNLPPALRAALVLTVLDGYTYQEAAAILSVPLGTIATRVHESRRLLKAAMGPPSEA